MWAAWSSGVSTSASSSAVRRESGLLIVNAS
jgi:hypothetical protein